MEELDLLNETLEQDQGGASSEEADEMLMPAPEPEDSGLPAEDEAWDNDPLAADAASTESVPDAPADETEDMETAAEKPKRKRAAPRKKAAPLEEAPQPQENEEPESAQEEQD